MTATVESAVRRFYAYRCVSSMGFTSVFLVAFLVAQGISFTTIALGVTALSVVNIAAEIPAGFVGDRFGRRASMVSANVLFGLTSIGWLVVSDVPGVVTVYGVLGVALSLRSGTTTSWLYDTLDEYGEADRYSEIASRSLSLMRATTAVTMLVGSGLYVLSPPYAFIAAALGSTVAAAMALMLPANRRYRGDSDDSDRVGPVEAAAALRSFVTMPAVRTIVGFSAVFASAVAVASRYLQPIVTEAAEAEQVVLADYLIPGVVILGAVGAAYTFVGAVAVDYADALEDRLGTGLTVGTIYAVSTVVMLVPFAATVFPVSVVAVTALAMVVFNSLPKIAGPVRNGYLHEYADTVDRATVMSGVTFSFSLVRVPVILAAGAVADAYSATLAVASTAAFALLVGGALLLVDGPLVAIDYPSDGRSPDDADTEPAD